MNKPNFSFIDSLEKTLTDAKHSYNTKVLNGGNIKSLVVELVDKNVPLENGGGNYNSKIFFYENASNERSVRFAIKSELRQAKLTSIANNVFGKNLSEKVNGDNSQEVTFVESVSVADLVEAAETAITTYNTDALNNKNIASTVSQPKRKRGRPALSDEEKAQRKAERTGKSKSSKSVIEKISTDEFVPVLEADPLDNEVVETVLEDSDILLEATPEQMERIIMKKAKKQSKQTASKKVQPLV